MKHVELTNKIVGKYFKLWSKLCTTSEEYPVCPFRLRNVKYINRIGGVCNGKHGAYQLFEIGIGADKENNIKALHDWFAVYLDTGKVTMV